ncbi:hypothetical protein KC19_12G071000 [Ceratodon purpureus]|uniref:Lachrymatory-factor synthase n=1 Tax=Ceratodon purpureus TaxID=3225 RepID=A0A8T0G565_CERPU|nr:hypothetical protein KC19_12G071000 [Ceratodon purpureus]
MADTEIGVPSAPTEGLVSAETLTPTTSTDGKWTSGIKGVVMNCPLDVTWDLFSDWGNWRWQTSSLLCEQREGESRKPGSLRFLKYPDFWLFERILEVDNEKHILSYSIEENSVFGGIKGFSGCIQFQESGDGKTMVEYWKFELEPVDNQTRESFCNFVSGHLELILAELERGAKAHVSGLEFRPNQTDLQINIENGKPPRGELPLSTDPCQ